jgi:Flp pilus assembly protein TadB
MTLSVVMAMTVWVGATLLLGELRWGRRVSLAQRFAPYLPGSQGGRQAAAGGTVVSLRAFLSPIAQSIGSRVSHLFGVSEELALRLERIHSPIGIGAWRLRQLAWTLASFVAGALVVAAVRPPAFVALLFLIGLPLLAFLLLEHRVATESARWQRRLFLELPVVSEQLGMLLSAGYSVGAALDRLSRRGNGACATDLARVCSRIRHGLGEHAALDEWVLVSGVPAVRRLVAVLVLDREAGDLGHLITEEARATRREVHRELIETIERRSQQVWVPVTIATLVPGVLFLAVPFVAAMQLFTSS